MRIFANLAMVACWAFLAFGVGVIVIATALGHYGAFYDVFDLPGDLPPPSGGMVVLTCGMIVLALVLLGGAFLSFSRLLRAADAADFNALGRWLGQGGGYLIAFWVVLTVISRVMPFPMMSGIAPEDQPEVDWIPLDLDLILLVLGIVMLGVSGTMRKAAAIEQENSEFL